MVVAAGCDKGSLGEYESESEGQSGSDSRGESESASASEGETSGASASASGGSDSAGGCEDADVPNCGCTVCVQDEWVCVECEPTGGAALCESPDFQCSAPLDCSVADCGAVESSFDANGCLRPGCSQHDECGSDERCYRGLDFGGCTSSSTVCSDPDGMCSCSSDDDCNGGHCVPEQLYPWPGELVPGPGGEGVGEPDCAPDDGQALRLTIGLLDPSCNGPREGPDLLHISLYDLENGFSLGPGTYPLGLDTGRAQIDLGGDMSIDDQTSEGFVRLFETNNVLRGEYELAFSEVYVGSFEVLYCEAPTQCG